VRYHLKIFCLHADEKEARFDREVEPEERNRPEWVSTFANNGGAPGPVLIVRIRALWSSRG
jgi:hypothetical protein